MLMYNESKLGERFYRMGFTNGYKFYECLLVAKYLRFVLGYKGQRCKRALIEFCEKWDKNFRYVPKRESIRNVLRESRSEFRKTNENIVIYKEEIEKVREIKNFKFQKALLCLIMIAKIKGKNYIKTNDWKFVRKIISKNISNHTDMEAIREAYQKGLICEPRYAATHEFSFLLDKGEVGISIHGEKEAFNLSNLYESYCGGSLGYCEDCGTEFVKETKNQIRCVEHQIERKKLKYNKYNNKRKQKTFV